MAGPVFYLIPGLGANGRIFERLRLAGTVHILEWLEPAAPDEPLITYAARLAAPIPSDEVCWLVGVSFGGVVALEIANQRPKARVVLISSISDPVERTGWVALGRWLRADAWLPIALLRKMPYAAGWFFGVSGTQATVLLREMLSHLTPTYTPWALRCLFRWPGCAVRPVAHLLGDRDRVFPAGQRSATHLIPGGTHFMVVTHAAIISGILNALAAAPQSLAASPTLHP
ncbi:MAG: alpha/beta hydrolase [Hymenobacteraceae bacterium]|nr:alpha/beta hydrolase [Hymenobacteraceae bacterium]